MNLRGTYRKFVKNNYGFRKGRFKDRLFRVPVFFLSELTGEIITDDKRLCGLTQIPYLCCQKTRPETGLFCKFVAILLLLFLSRTNKALKINKKRQI